MSKIFNALRYTMALKMGDGDLDSLVTTLEDVPDRFGSAAGALDLLAQGFRSGFFDGQDGRVAGLIELLARGMHFLAEEEGDLLYDHAAALRTAQKGAPSEFVKPQKEGATS